MSTGSSVVSLNCTSLTVTCFYMVSDAESMAAFQHSKEAKNLTLESKFRTRICTSCHALYPQLRDLENW